MNSETIKQIFDNGLLPHALLLFGDNKEDIKQIVFNLISHIEGKTNLSDTYIIKLEEDQNSIGIESIREAKNFLFSKPTSSPKRILVIESAESLTVESQNALLKTLEEAPSHGLVIIIAKHKDLLLPTIISRLQSVFIKTKPNIKIPDQEINKVKIFLQGGYSKDFIKQIADNNPRDFLNNLIFYLSQDIKNNSFKISKILNTLTILSELQVNKKIQLEALSENIK